MTLSEVLLWNELKQKQILGFDFDRKRPVDNYIVDFYCNDLMLAIEIDGSNHHTHKVQRIDKKGQKTLESLGVSFLRFNDVEVKKNIVYVVNEIYKYVDLHKNNLVGRIYE